ncbi:MAG TPA: M48 family metalloprotease [Parvularculaceae bacterium]|nr:M48 family metalloprotease [Parvularculaceae bacterium]
MSLFFRVKTVLAFVFAAPLLCAAASAQSLLRDAEIEQFLNDYSRPVFQAAGLPADQIEILLIGDQSFNAFAGGLVMGVNTGLLTISDNPRQIQGVIAHEAGHIAGGHSARSDEALASATRPMLLSLVLAAGAIAAGAPDAGVGILGLGQTIGIANALKYSRGQESSADQAALTYLDAIGRSGAGLVESFRNLSNEQIIHGRRVNPYMQTHPLALQRVTALEERAKASPYYDVEDSPEEIERLRLIQAKIKGFLQDANSTLREYPYSDQSDAAHYARAVAYYRSADLERALSEIGQLLAAHPDNPYYNELKGQMLFEFGRIADSIEPHRRSVELAPGKALLLINLARALSATEEPEKLRESVKDLKSALLIEPDNSFGWFELARAYGALGEEPLADLAMAESRYNEGAKPEAASFASRARAKLQKGTPEWRQATDIIVASLGSDPAAGVKRKEGEAPPKSEPERRPGEVPDPQ